MFRTMVLPFVVLMHHCLVKAQEPCVARTWAHQAEILYRNDLDIVKAVFLYQRALANGFTDGSVQLDAITCATKIKDTTALTQLVSKALILGMPAHSINTLWKHIGNGMDSSVVWKSIDSTRLTILYRSYLDEDLVKKLQLMKDRDQQYRSDDRNYTAQRSLDSLNWKELKELVIKKKGFPAYREMGFEGSENIRIIFYHMDKNELEWFLPHVIKSEQRYDTNLGHTFLYQLDRIGISEGQVYTIKDNKIVTLGPRTILDNGFACQNFGEWFDEKSQIDGKMYETPFDPLLSLEEINRIRLMFCLPNIQQHRLQRPWVISTDRITFEKMVKE